MLDWTGEYSDSQARQWIVNMRVSGTSDLLSQAIQTIKVLHRQREQSRLKHDVTEGNMTLAEDMRPEATLLVGVS